MVGRPIAVVLAVTACTPELVDSTSIVTAPRLLAIRATPAESAPGDVVTTEALWVDPTTPAGSAPAPLEWAFCTARKALTDPGPVSSRCFVPTSDELIVYGEGTSAAGAVPSTACSRFGPDAPEPIPGESSGRPVDPDGTGGYFQPIRVRAEATDVADALGQVRLRCALPGATLAQATEYRERYVLNQNPTITRVEVPGAVPAGAAIELVVHWDACTTAPCGGSEPYLWFDPVTRRLTDRREGMRVSWFATAGAFETGRSGVSEADADQTSARVAWTAPGDRGDVYLWFVLRDDRGGVTWSTAVVPVE